MRRSLNIDRLPTAIPVEQAVEVACAEHLAFIESRLRRGTSVLVDCDKELWLYLYLGLRKRLKGEGPRLTLVDGRPRSEEDCAGLSGMLQQLTNAIRGAVDRRVVVLPHLDVLTTTHTVLTMEAREAIPLLYENPEVVFLGFRDPSFPIPKVIEQVFGARREIVGVPRTALPAIITQREARALHAERFDPFALYKYVSGLNPVRCRKLFTQLGLRREALPGRPATAAVYRELREQTAGGDAELPQVDLERDVGGYPEVKARLREDLIDLLATKDRLESPEDIAQLESLLPRGIIFHGPPGTGKTWFAKALATALDATLIVVSGPELKSKWVGESEENLRGVFRRARACAPALIVFDEIDAFAQRRGTYQGSGVEHSMVNQLLTEMDGFRKNEIVFVVGTTNFLDSVDGALLRPGRFEFLIEIPAPEPEDRAAIARIYDQRLGLGLTPKTIEHLVRRTEGLADPEQGLPFTGDHIYALCRALKRLQLRGAESLGPDEVDRALERRTHRPVVLSPSEERVIAVHEAGHALLAMLIPEATPPERISIAADRPGSLGYVIRAARARPYTVTEADLKAELCVGLGGQAAERLVLGQASIGATQDLHQVTRIARAMVEQYGMSAVGPRAYVQPEGSGPESEARRAATDEAIDALLAVEQVRATRLLQENEALHAALVALLLEEKVLDAGRLQQMVEG